MKLKKVEMFGFKSFADKINIQFEEGVTGIVGPNGCGKSNVADAIKWVLGEQSAKVLRGQNMQDVIFNGTEKRKSQSFCEVSLFFDNSTKLFPVDYDEVIISRKLYRSGDSFYLINKNECRLKDIVDLFRDSGLGKESYSIIGQGRIDEILSVKPENRRAIFEEAAGISKFKNRKDEAERKLERTHDNLLRVNDIVHELEIQLEPLKEQAESAKKYLELKEQLKILEVNTYITQYDSASGNKEKIAVRISAIDEELNHTKLSFEDALKKYDNCVNSINSLDEHIEVLRDELLSLTVSMEKQAGESKLLTERNQNLKDLQIKLLEDGKSFTDKQKAYEKERDEQAVRLNDLQDKVFEIRREIDKSTEMYLSIVDKINSCEIEMNASGNEEIEALNQLSNVKADISGLDAKQEALKIKIEENRDRKKIVLEKSSQFSNDCLDVDIQLKTSANQLKELEHTQSKTVTENQNLIVKQNETKKLLDDLNAVFHSSSSKLNLLSEMQRVNEGYVYSVKKILNDAKTNSSLGGLVVGVVASLIKVPEKYETAIEMALGGAIQNIVTKNEDDAKLLVEYLKKNNLGRATFLPITSVKEKYLSKEYVACLKIKGCYGVASDLISFDKKYENVFTGLLGSTVIVENIDVAISLAKIAKYGFKIVTLDGDIINPFGSISGGSKKSDGLNLLGREREIEKIKNGLNEISANLHTETNNLSKISAKIEENVQKIKNNSELIVAAEMKIESLSQKKNELESLVADLKNEDSMLESQYVLLMQKYKENENVLSVNVGLESRISSSRVNANSNKQSISSEYEKLKEQRLKINEDLSNLKVTLAKAESEYSSIKVDTARIERELGALVFIIQQNEIEQKKTISDIAQNEKQIADNMDNELFVKNKSQLEKIRGELASLDGKKDALQKDMQEADGNKLILSSSIQSLSEKRNKEEMQLIKIDTDIETMQERIWDEYALTYALANAYKQEDFKLEKGLAETSRLKKAISALGNINVNAIEQLKDVDERYQGLFTQKTDLQNAENDLVKIISELTGQMKDRFVIEFKKINENFKQIFSELFNGGRAEIRLEDEENALESGIEIVAEPSGKKLQNITLLSGGEKAMTAIAILFAILKLKPMPFCVLDEIEAALDDANTDRFARYLKKFSTDTQFIVITHKKPTMELADSLYGVTMEEKGVSKMVSVKLSDAIKNVQGVN